MKKEFRVDGIHCASCIKLIKMSVEELAGIKAISGDEKKSTVKVEFDEKKTSTEQIISKIEESGYKASLQK